MSNSEVFVDGLLNVTLVKGLVRLDFFTLSATETQKDGQPAPAFRERLVMNPQSLMEVYQSLHVAIMALNEKGVIGIKPPPALALPHPGPVAAAPAPSVAPPHSNPIASPDADPIAKAAPKSRNFPTTMGN